MGSGQKQCVLWCADEVLWHIGSRQYPVVDGMAARSPCHGGVDGVHVARLILHAGKHAVPLRSIVAEYNFGSSKVTVCDQVLVIACILGLGQAQCLGAW
jgi:hypothetical protein